jgi:hypothetical protein
VNIKYNLQTITLPISTLQQNLKKKFNGSTVNQHPTFLCLYLNFRAKIVMSHDYILQTTKQNLQETAENKQNNLLFEDDSKLSIFFIS